jgi:hypothetical protein
LACLLAAAQWCHEPWADEAHSWLLARDAGIVHLWGTLLSYEGTPGLWHTILYSLIRAGLPYSGLSILSALIGLGGAWLLVRYAPFPLAIRLALPCTFFLAYQYAIVARSYVLLPPLLFATAMVYRSPVRRAGTLSLLLSLMALVSVHGLALSGLIWLFANAGVVRRWKKLLPTDRGRVGLGAAVYGLAVTAAVLSAWPPADAMFVTRPNWSAGHLLKVAGDMLREPFAGGWIGSAAIVGFSLPALRRGGGLGIFVASFAALSAIGAIIYTQVWHQGIVFVAWLFAAWVSAGGGLPRMERGMLHAALAAAIAVQGYWTFRTIRYDWYQPYSGAADAAAYLQSSGIWNRELYAIGYACTAIQPYFARNIFANVNGGRLEAFWDWSERNHVNELSEHRRIMHFDGHIYWRSAILEPEAYDLYQRPVTAVP